MVPRDVLAYNARKVEDVAFPLWLRKYSVPYWVLPEIFGGDANYCYRIECSLGRCSVAGALSTKANTLPEHFVADEKHAKHLEETPAFPLYQIPCDYPYLRESWRRCRWQ